MLDEGVEEIPVSGITTARHVDDDPEERGVGREAFIRILLP